jgi:hypothetical protein
MANAVTQQAADRFPTNQARRRWLKAVAGLGATGAALALVPEVRVFAQQVQDFIEGPPVPDVKPEQLSPHVWMVYAKEGFPTQENQGLMASIIFVVTQKAWSCSTAVLRCRSARWPSA